MYNSEDYFEVKKSKYQIHFNWKLWQIDQIIYVNRDMIDFDLLTEIYKLAPIEAMKFELFFKAEMKKGPLIYIETIKDILESNFIENTENNYVNQMIRRTLSNKSYINSRVNSVRGKI